MTFVCTGFKVSVSETSFTLVYVCEGDPTAHAIVQLNIRL